MIEDMTIRNLSPTTQRSYIHAVEGYSRCFGRSPDRHGLEDVRAYQVHLAGKGIAWATLNQIVCALRFLYGVTLDQDAVPERIPYARKRATLPDVLNRDEVVRFLEAVPSPFSATRYHSLIVARDTLPATLIPTASTDDGLIMAMHHRDFPIHGVQFHPESIASEHGHRILANFLAIARFSNAPARAA